MGKENYRYNFVNILVLLVVVIIFAKEYKDIGVLLGNVEFKYGIVLIFTVIVVHAIKAFRLYLALYGMEITVSSYLKTYCKVTPVSVILPYKVGEIFRMYCYGRQIKSLFRGTIIVLFDRFMDTLALVTMIFVIRIFNGGDAPKLAYLLIMFLGILFVIYFVFPGIYDCWKKFLLSTKATENKMTMLRIITTMGKIHQEISSVAKGRGFILYVLSMVAWSAELGSIAVIIGSENRDSVSEGFSRYLSTAMGTGTSVELKRFIVVSVVTLIVVYIIVKGKDVVKAERIDK